MPATLRPVLATALTLCAALAIVPHPAAAQDDDGDWVSQCYR